MGISNPILPDLSITSITSCGIGGGFPVTVKVISNWLHKALSTASFCSVISCALTIFKLKIVKAINKKMAFCAIILLKGSCFFIK